MSHETENTYFDGNYYDNQRIANFNLKADMESFENIHKEKI